MAKAPLIIGCDLSTASQDSIDILMNKDLIDVNQDPNSKQATCFLGCSKWETFMRHPQVYATTVTGGHTVAMIVNWREHAHKDFEFKLQDLGVVARGDQLIEVWDLWTHEMLGEYSPTEIETFGVGRLLAMATSYSSLSSRTGPQTMTISESCLRTLKWFKSDSNRTIYLSS